MWHQIVLLPWQILQMNSWLVDLSAKLLDSNYQTRTRVWVWVREWDHWYCISHGWLLEACSSYSLWSLYTNGHIIDHSITLMCSYQIVHAHQGLHFAHISQLSRKLLSTFYDNTALNISAICVEVIATHERVLTKFSWPTSFQWAKCSLLDASANVHYKLYRLEMWKWPLPVAYTDPVHKFTKLAGRDQIIISVLLT